MSLSVRVSAGTNKNDSSVDAKGSVTRLITEHDQNTFGLSNRDLPNVMANYMGRRPNDIFLKSPTPWGDLFKTYNITETHTNIDIVDSSILDVRNDTTMLKQDEYKNNSSVVSKIKTSIEQQVENTVSSTWTSNHEIGVSQSISYSIIIASGETSFNYQHSWGTSKTISETVTLKSSTDVEVELQPQQAVTVELRASRGVMRVQVNYAARLSGSAALNYNPTHNGHHFWFPAISNVLSRNNLKNPIIASEIIEIGYYYNTQVVIRDKATGRILNHLI